MTGFDLDRRVVHAMVRAGARHRAALRQPDRGRRRQPVVLRPRRAGPFRPGHEDDRRRPGAAPADLRRVRDGRDGARPPASGEHWLTVADRRCRPDGRGAGRPGPRAGRAQPDRRVPHFDPASVRVLLLDGGKEPLATFGDKLSGKAATELERARRRAAHGRSGSSASTSPASTSTTRTARRLASKPSPPSGPPACRRRRWPAELAKASGAERGPQRAHRRAPRPHAARPPRGLRHRRHGRAQRPARAWRRSRCRAACTPPTRSSRRLEGEDAVPFTYRDMGSVATIGRFRAIASVRKRHFSGLLGWFVWFFVHLAFLNGFGDRLSTMLRWLRSMVGRGRAEREFSTAHSGGDLSLPTSVGPSSSPTSTRTRRPPRYRPLRERAAVTPGSWPSPGCSRPR